MIYAYRGVDLMIAVMGVLKAGQHFPSLTLLTLQQDRIFIFLWQNQKG